jgi:hypothetical protein
MWEKFMDELRAEHLGSAGAAPASSVRAQLRAAYDEVVARRR